MTFAPPRAGYGLAVALLCAGLAANAQQPGLDARPANPACIAPAAPNPGATITVQSPFPAAAFARPVKLLQPPGDATRWFVAEEAGRVMLLRTSAPASPTVWLDITAKVDDRDEGGLLGMALHPQWPAVREMYLSYTIAGATPGVAQVSIVSRLIVDDVDAPATAVEQVLLTVNQPYTNHNGGDIAFGPDGHLYVGLGDGGSGGDPGNHAQDTTDLLGSMLRIDVLGVPPGERYRIPPDNPFAGNARCGPGGNGHDCPEIWAWGLRNPFRFSFDGATGALWAGDVGQNAREEVDVLERGGNYGWRCLEGTQAYDGSSCPSSGFAAPVFDYGRTVGQTVIGGVVYRGAAIPALRGAYLFGDYSAAWIARLVDDGTGRLARQQLAGGHVPTAFATAADGEVWFADHAAGRLRRLAPAGSSGTDTIPASLADTGCVDPANPALPAGGLIPYDINAPFWSDGASKERWLALPDGATVTVDAAGDWALPAGAVLMKHFRLAGQLVETRLLMRHTDGSWGGTTYEWNDAGTAATRVVGGKVRRVQGQDWIYPSENQCRACHTAVAGFSLGLEHAQLNRDFRYPSTGRTANQLATLSAIGLFAAPLPAPATLPRLADPADTGLPVHARARAWLHANCAGCHRSGGPTPVSLDLRAATTLQDMAACNVAPTAGDLGIADARIVAPGADSRSVLAVRDARRDAAGMPPLGSALADLAGTALVGDWILRLGSCTDSDADMADDARDNCRLAANTDQRDSNGDGFGNRCDADLDDSGFVNATDLAIFRLRFGTPDPHADLDGSGSVNAADLAIFRSLFGKAPGPAGL